MAAGMKLDRKHFVLTRGTLTLLRRHLDTALDKDIAVIWQNLSAPGEGSCDEDGAEDGFM